MFGNIAPHSLFAKPTICLLSARIYIETTIVTNILNIPFATSIIPFAYSVILSRLMYSSKLNCDAFPDYIF